MHRTFTIILLLLLFSLVGANQLVEENLTEIEQVIIPEVGDFSVEGRQAAAEDRIIMLLVSQVHCPYCVLIKEEIIYPMIRGGDHAEQLLIRELFIDRTGAIIGFDGKSIDAMTFASQHGARLTPTLLFLDEKGNELTERMVGINTPEMYFYYVDQAIRKALLVLKS